MTQEQSILDKLKLGVTIYAHDIMPSVLDSLRNQGLVRFVYTQDGTVVKPC